jgi:RHS repeat-associated protein
VNSLSTRSNVSESTGSPLTFPNSRHTQPFERLARWLIVALVFLLPYAGLHAQTLPAGTIALPVTTGGTATTVGWSVLPTPPACTPTPAGTLTATIPPQFGTLTFPVSNLPVGAGQPCAGTVIPWTFAVYTWNRTGPGEGYDYMHLHYTNPDGGPIDSDYEPILITGMPSRMFGHSEGGRCDCVGDPVSIVTGNMYYSTTDYKTAGANPLQFTRYYNSRSAVSAPTFAVGLGTGWRSTFDRYIHITSASTVTIERPDGQQVYFTLGSVWTPESDVNIKLTNSGSTWTLTDHDDTVETYTTTSGGTEALLESIKARNGYTQTLSYNGSDQLTSVTDSYSRGLTLSYSGSLLASIGTPDSTTISYTFTTSGGTSLLSSVSFPTSPTGTVQYEYGGSSSPATALTSIIDENGNIYASWLYDAYSRATQSQLGSGANLTTLAFTDDGSFTRTVTNAFGVQDTYLYLIEQGIPKVSEIERNPTSTTPSMFRALDFDVNGYLRFASDWNGHSTVLSNNSNGDPLTITEADGTAVQRITTIAYDPTWVHLPDSITTPGLTTSFTYDGSGDVLTATQTDTTTTTTPYSTNGQTRTWTNTWSDFLVASVKTPNGNTTSFGYSGSGALTSITDALSHATHITSYTGGGRPETIVDPNSVTTTLTYDPRQRLLSSEVSGSSGNFTTSNTYDAAGNLMKTTLPDSSYIANTYDTAHRITKITDALGNYTIYALNALGERTQVNVYDNSGGSYLQHSDTYDALGRMLVDTGGRGQTITNAYDKNGNITSFTDGLSHVTSNTYDALNRLTTSTDPNTGVTTLTYDAHNRTTNVQDPNLNSTAYVYNGFGDSIQQTSPDSGATVFYYDGDANLTKRVDALNVTVNLAYDSLDRLLTSSFPADSTQNATYTYDSSPYVYGFPIGRLATRTDATGLASFDYDERGNLVQLTRWSTPGGVNLTSYYAYDAVSRVSDISYPSGLNVSYYRDAQGRINQVDAIPAGQPAEVVAWMGNDPFGPMNYITYGNLISGPNNVDRDYSIFNITLSGTSGTLQNVSYSLDGNNNVTGVTDAVNSANSQTLGYDVLNRLTSATSSTGGYGSLSWTYDKVGNRLSQILGSTTTTYGYTGGTNRLSSINSTSVSTNADGNITSIPPANSSAAATFAYNVAGRPSSVTGPPLSASFVYDDFGERFSKADSGSYPTYYTYGQDGALLEENNNGAITDYIYIHGRPIGLFVPGGTSGTLYYVHPDRSGIPQFVTNSSQATVWSTTYQPFGTTNLITASLPVQNVRLPGQNFDVETGFHYNHFRDYMPNLGRYLEADPTGLKGGLNPYLYANANPAGFTDSDGLEGHHVFPQTFWRNTNIPQPAQQVFNNATIPTAERHGWSKLHAKYNVRAGTLFNQWCEENQVDPTKMTGEQAQTFLRALTQDPEISAFNQSIARPGVNVSLPPAVVEPLPTAPPTGVPAPAASPMLETPSPMLETSPPVFENLPVTIIPE